MYSFPNLEPVCYSMSSSNSCFLTCIQISQEAGQVVWYSHHFQNFPQITVIYKVKGLLCIRWPKYWSFSFNISPSNEHPGLISFRMDWLDLLAVQGTLKSLLQHHSSKASILLHSALFIVQLSHPYMTTEKIIALTRRTFVDKVMSVLCYLVWL